MAIFETYVFRVREFALRTVNDMVIWKWKENKIKNICNTLTHLSRLDSLSYGQPSANRIMRMSI